MRRRSLIQAISVVAAAAAGRLLALYPPRAAVAAPTETPPGNGIGGMMGGMGEMMQAGNMMGPMRTGMELFMR
ncbi:MAG: hypothetical protein ACREE9_11610, partial [Stellaceae bacterium]